MRLFNRLPIITLIYGLLLIAGCSSGGDSSTTNDPPTDDTVTVDPVVLDSVSALFTSNGAEWNDYVQGQDFQNATDNACLGAGSSSCVHGGEIRRVEATGITSCTGLSATDALGAFVWECDDSTNPVRMVSTGLADGKYLSHLINFTSPPTFKENSVTVFLNGTAFGNTPASEWWGNPLVINNTGGNINDSGTIYLVTANPSQSYNFINDKLALVIQPGVTLTGPGGGFAVVALNQSRDYFWIEGNIDAGSSDAVGVEASYIRYLVARNLQVENATSSGIIISFAGHPRFTDVTANNNGSGIVLSSVDDGQFSNITAEYNGIGTSLYQSNRNTFSNLVSNNNTFGDGLVLDQSSDNALDNVSVSNNKQSGVNLKSNSNNNQFTGVSAIGNTGTGVNLTSSDNIQLTDVIASHNGQHGISVLSAADGRFTNLTVSNNSDAGISIASSGGYKLQKIVAINNGGIGMYLEGANHTLFDMIATNNANALADNDTGFLLSATNSRVAMVSTGNNRQYGIILDGDNNTVLGLSAGNHLLYGLDLRSNNNTLQAVAVTNATFGINLNGNTGNVFANTASASNAFEDIRLNTIYDVQFTGLLEVGGSLYFTCYVTIRTGYETPGLVNDTCAANGASDHLLLVPVDLSEAFVGQVAVDDSNNSSDVDGSFSGFPVDTALFDWSKFDNSFRGWGVGSGSFRGAWTNAGGDGGIWDWSASSADNGAVGAGCASPPCPALLGVVEDAAAMVLPDGDYTFTHVWNTASGDDAYCNEQVAGSTWNGAACVTKFLRDSMEIMSDGIGNDNTLCESGETCLYMPNIGSYQGHGNLVSAGAFVNGTLTGITLMKYETNGR